MKPRESAPSQSHLGSRSESGSAYLATLLVLVVLTILGLSLAVITQTEVLIGGSEKQATRQLFASSSGAQAAAVYELVSRDSASHRLRIGQRSESILGQTTVIGDDLCTTPYAQISRTLCNLCDMSEGDYWAVGYGVTAVALRRGDTALGARKTIGTVVTFEPWQLNINGFQFGGDEPFRTPADLTIDIDPSTEVDPCEGLFLKI
ncbi:MAG: hypothetical protein ABI689_13485 [Thermoanaerobaculia bacterium]